MSARKNSGYRHLIDDGIRRQRLGGLLPATEDLVQELLDVALLEVPVDRHDDPVGMDVLLVKFDQIVASDRLDGGVLGVARVGMVLPVDELQDLTEGDLEMLIVPGGDGRSFLFLGQIDLVVRKGGVAKYFR